MPFPPIRFRAASLVLALSLASLAGAMEFTETQRAHWAWKPPVRRPLPPARKGEPAHPVDRLLTRRLREKGLRLAPTASRETLIRRLAFDLTGLPPTPAEVDRFLKDRGPEAWSRVVEHYLGSPAFGERWGRHWLDIARYADSNGYEFDEVRPDMWRYRDYVIWSFNSDRPYDRFIVEQLAGDQLNSPDPSALIATGFNLLGPDMTDAADQAARRQNTLNDMTDTAGLAFLGLTVGCARCHDHKYEPISQADYYRLQAFFAGSEFRRDLVVATPDDRARYEVALRQWRAELARLRGELERLAGGIRRELRQTKIARLPEDLRTAFNLPESERMPDQQKLVDANERNVEPTAAEIAARLPADRKPEFAKVEQAYQRHLKSEPRQPHAMGLSEARETPRTFILGRGEISNREEEVAPGYPVILASTAEPKPASGRRLTLARWIASPRNPLTARVMVNRVWQHLFGRGIVPTPSDFGVRGESATHPEVLDWLAVGFSSGDWPALPRVERKAWSIKNLIRVLVHSNAYKQSSHASAAALKADPDNELFSRMNRKRLEGEAIRDAGLAVSGRLNPKMGGMGVFPPIPPEARPANANVWPVTRDPAEHRRRSIYIFVRRNLGFPGLDVFDGPDTNSSCPRREVTTSAPQALTLINSPESLANARAFAGRVLAAGAGEAERIQAAYRVAFARAATAGEIRAGKEFLARQSALLNGRPAPSLNLPEPFPDGLSPAAGAAWTDYCLALLNLNEFIYID